MKPFTLLVATLVITCILLGPLPAQAAPVPIKQSTLGRQSPNVVGHGNSFVYKNQVYHIKHVHNHKVQLINQVTETIVYEGVPQDDYNGVLEAWARQHTELINKIEESKKTVEQGQGPLFYDHNTSLTLMRIGASYADEGKNEKAKLYYQNAEPGLRSLGTNHPDFGGLMMNWGNQYEGEEATAYYQKPNLAYEAWAPTTPISAV
jgi:hypothetical protein